MAQFYAVIKPSSQAHHRWRMGSLPRGTLHGTPFYWRGGRYVSDVVTEKHLIHALMDDPDVEVNMIAVASYPVVDATLVDIIPVPVEPVEVPLASEEWMEVEDEPTGYSPMPSSMSKGTARPEGFSFVDTKIQDESEQEKTPSAKQKPIPRKRSN